MGAKPPSPIPRRAILRTGAVAGGALATGVAGATIGRSRTERDTGATDVTELAARRTVYVDPTVPIALPARVATTDDPADADVAMYAADTAFRRRDGLSLLDAGVTVSFVGPGAEETVLETLFDEPSGAISSLAGHDVSLASDVPHRVGFEYVPAARSVGGALRPAAGTLETVVVRGSNDASGTEPVESLSMQAVELLNAIATLGDERPVDPSGSCPDGFDCIGRHLQFGETSWGEWQLAVEGGEYVIEDGHSYVSFECTLKMQPITGRCCQDPRNGRMHRHVDFDDAVVLSSGPDSQNSATTQTVSVGVGSGGPHADWSWTNPAHEYEIDLTGSFPHGRYHDWKNFSGDTRTQLVRGSPGYRTKTEGAQNAHYTVENYWRWHKSPFRSSTERLTGYGYWWADRNRDEPPCNPPGCPVSRDE